MRTLHLIESAHGGHTTTGIHSVVSLSAHIALVIGALYFTARETVAREREPDTRVYFTPDVARRAATRASQPTPPVATSPQIARPALPQVQPPSLVVPVAIPPVSAPLPGPGAPDFQVGDPGIDAQIGVPGTPVPDRSGPFEVGEVESPAAPLFKGGPKYPPNALSLGISGSVSARFVVGADGRVESDIQILQSTAPEFSAAVRNFLRHARFRAAKVGGRPVRQLVEQRFVFELRP